MDKNRKEGASREVKGRINEAVGDATDDRSQELKGKVQKNAGEAQREVGRSLDNDRDTRN